jgi:hypothetical protein
MDEKKSYVYLHFDVPLGPKEDRFEISVRVPKGKLLVIHECQVAIEGDEPLRVDQAWCAISGGDVNDGGLHLRINGEEPPPLRSPQLLLNHVTETTTPQEGRLFVIGPSNLYLPTTGEVVLRVFRYPATVGATAIFSLTGTVSPYSPD